MTWEPNTCSNGLVELALMLTLLSALLLVFLVVMLLASPHLSRTLQRRYRVGDPWHQTEGQVERLQTANIIGILRANLDGAILDGNDEFLRLLGYSREELHQGTVRWDTATPLEYSALDTAAIAQLRHRGVCAPYEKELIHRNGDRIPVLIGSALLEEPGDQCIAFVLDLSRQKQTEAQLRASQEALRQSEERWQLALRGNNDGIWDWNVQTNEVFFSERWKEMLGYRNEEVQNSLEEWSKRVHPDDLGWVTQAIQDHFAQKTPYYITEHRVLAKDGTYKWILDRGQVLLDEQGNPIRMVGSHTDVSDRKQAEQALQESETRLRLALEAAHMGTWTWDLVTGNVAWSQQHAELFGISLDHFDGSMEMFASCVHPEDLQAILDEIDRAMVERDDYHHEFRIIWPDGSIHWIEGKGRFFYNNRGEPLVMRGAIVDITVRKQAEEVIRQTNEELERRVAERTRELEAINAQLRESEEKFRQLAETIQEVFWMVDPIHHQWIYISPAYESIWARDRHTLLHQFEDWLAGVHPDDREQVRASFVHCLSHGQYDQEYRLLWPTGEVRWVHDRGFPVYTEDGQLHRITGIAEDITVRKQTEEALRASKQRLSIALNAAKAGTWEWHSDTNQAFWSSENYRLLGYEPGSCEASYDRWLEAIHPDDRTIADRYVQSVMACGVDLNFEYRVSLPNGSIRWLNDIGQIIYDEQGRIKGMVGIQMDITDRKLAEEAIRRNEAWFRTLSESSPVGVFRMNAQGHCIYTNPRCQTIGGFSFEEALGEGWLKFIHPEDLPSMMEEWSRAIAQRTGFSKDLRYLHRDGTVCWGRLHTAPIQSDVNDCIGHVGTVEDITLTREVDRMKSEFISVVSHELRTPLTSIRGSLGLLSTGALANHPDKAQRMIEIAVTDTERLVRLVNDILDLERLESGKFILNKELCYAADLMQRAVETLRAIAEREQIQIVVTPTQVQVLASADHIIQTLTNLLSNAIKFSPPGSTVWLSAEIQNLDGESSAASPPSTAITMPYVLFTVADRGRGIPPDKLETIFGRFQQVDASDSRQKGGTGLGLAICQSIIHQHGGAIGVDSTPGQGSCFYFSLPLPSDWQRLSAANSCPSAPPPLPL